MNKKNIGMGIHNSIKPWALGLVLSVSPLSLSIAVAAPASTAPAETAKQIAPVSDASVVDPIDQAAMQRKPDMPGALNTLQTALESAYRNNTEIKDLQASLRARDEGLPQALAGWRPTVYLDASIGGKKEIYSGDRKDGRDTTVTSPGANGQNSSTATAGVTLRQNLFEGGKTVASTCQAENLVQVGRAQLADKEKDILLAAVQSYVTLIAKHAELELRKSNEGTLKKTLEATQDKFNVGEETRTSIAQAQAELADAIAKRQTTEAQLLAATATFERVTGAHPGKLKKPGEPSNLPANLKEAIDIAQKNNPAILAAFFQEKADRNNIKVKEAELLPKIDLEASTTRRGDLTRTKFPAGSTTRSENHDFTTAQNVALTLRMPIYEAGAIRGKGRELRETAEQRRIQIETKRREVIEKLSEAWETYIAAKASVKNYQSQVKSNEVALEGTRQELLVGSKILLDVLNAQRTLVASQLNLVQEEQRYYQASYSVLAFMGRLTALDMKLQVKQYDPQVHYQDVKYSW